MMQSYTTERLLLRRAKPEDASDIYRNIADWDVIKMLARPPWPYPRELADEYVRTTKAFMLEHQGAVIGTCTIDGREYGPMLGFWIGKDYWGKGLMTEAATRLVAAYFAETREDELHSSHLLDNPGSWRVQEKIGFRPKHEAKFFVNSRGGEHPAMVTVLPRHDFEARYGIRPEPEML